MASSIIIQGVPELRAIPLICMYLFHNVEGVNETDGEWHPWAEPLYAVLLAAWCVNIHLFRNLSI